jgi:hypothetical protein
MPTAEGDAPEFDQGESDDSPTPVPKAKRARKSAAVTNAPDAIAAHDTPEVDASFLAGTGTWGVSTSVCNG